MRRLVICVVWTAGLAITAQPQPAGYEKYLQQGVELRKQARFAEAEAVYTAAIRDLEQRHELDYPVGTEILDLLGSLQAAAHHYDSARATFLRSLAIREQALGPAHPEVGLLLTAIAMTHHLQGRNGIAESMYRRALGIVQKTLAPDDSLTAMVQLALGKLVFSERRNTEAEELLEKAVPVFQLTPKFKLQLAQTLTCLADAYQMDGRYNRADALYRRVLRLVEEDPTLKTEEIMLGLRHYTVMLRRTRRKAEARQLQEQMKTLLPK